ncbi:MAG: hemerythrin domain-containing protein [Myxococcales bacterium]
MSLVQLKLPQPETDSSASHPVDGLLACHARIREFTQLSASLAAAQADPASAQSAAGAVRRYFAQALPLHEADEDLSIAPRLRALHPQDTLVQALDLIARQHPDIDRVIGRMMPLWEAIEADGTRLPALAEQLAKASERLSMIWTPHLALEETEVFPAIRELLSPEAVEAVRAEMAERRRQ